MVVANRGLTVLVTVVVVNLLLLATGTNGLCLDINPEKCTATIEDKVHLSCVPDGLNQDLVNEITLIKISRNDEKEPIAFLSHCSNITYGTDMEERFKANGYIGKDFGNSSLNMTLMDPRSQDTGIYTCVMFYVDTSGDLKEEVTSGNLIVEKLDVKTLETVLNDLRNEIKSVKSNGNNQINKLQEQANRHNDELANLNDKVGSTVAFSAQNTLIVKTINGQPIVFDTIIMQIGHGYDASTGIFKAPLRGLYVFSLVVMGYPDCDFRVRLKVNDTKIIATVYNIDKDYWTQSSASTVTELKPGDTVKAVTDSTSCKLNNHNFSLFSGYLLQAL